MRDLPEKCYIVNKTTTSDGKSLAVTWLGGDAVLTVAEFERLPTQVWIVNDRNHKDQALSPLTDPDACALPYDRRTVTVANQADKWVWSISESDDTYIIQDWDHYAFWDIWSVGAKEQVLTNPGPEAKNQYWKLIAVD